MTDNLFAKAIQEAADMLNTVTQAKRQVTGLMGEAVFGVVAESCLSKYHYILSNVVLKAPNGTTQIDQVIISKYGIFVVEVKAFKGWIFGNQKNPEWTQCLFNNKNRFQNPLRQNYKHIKSLQSLLHFPADKFKSLIVFSGEAVFKTDMPDNVVRGAEDYVRFILKHTDIILPDNAVEKAVKTVSENRLSSREHDANIEKLKKQYSEANRNNPPSCPRCGRKMALRTAKQGHYQGRNFWGCSGYPNCKSVVNIKTDKESTEEQVKSIERAFNFFSDL